MLVWTRRIILSCPRSAPRYLVRAMTVQANDAKRKFLRIGTHSGTFHCDEALGCFLLQQVLLRHNAKQPAAPPPSRAAVPIPPRRRPAMVQTCCPAHAALPHPRRDPRASSATQTAAFQGAEVVRSRDPEVLKDLDVIIDVGATYEPRAPWRAAVLKRLSCQPSASGIK